MHVGKEVAMDSFKEQHIKEEYPIVLLAHRELNRTGNVHCMQLNLEHLYDKLVLIYLFFRCLITFANAVQYKV